MRAVWVAGLVAVVSCTSAGPVPERKAPVAVAPATPDEREQLWALAPEGATLGIVVSPRGVAMIERAVATAQEVLASSADFASIHGEVMHALMGALGTPDPTLAGFGLSHDRGFAMFVVDDGQVVMVLPVGDRERFVAALQGSRSPDGDVVATWVCQTIGGRYVCAQRRGLFAKLGHGGLDATRRLAPARGDIEIAARGILGPLGRSLAAAAELDRGTMILRGTVEGAARTVADALGAPGQPHGGAAGAAGFGVIDLTPVLTAMPSVPIAPGVTVGDVARTFAGPLTYVVDSGTDDPGIRIPLRDPGPVKALVEHCEAWRPLAQVGATVRDGTCRVPVPGRSLVIESWLDGSELRIGNRAARKASAVAPSPLASELARGSWSVALFGRGRFLDFREVRSVMALPPWAEGLVRVWPLLSELGLGIRKDRESVHFLVGARTVWSNPDDVVHKLLAISSDDLQSGKGVETGTSIASGAPSSPFAHDFRAGTAGFMGLAVAIGTLVGIAGPAWTDHVQRETYMPSQVHLGDGERATKPASGFPLVAARAALTTTIFLRGDRTPAPDPPMDVFVKTHYPRGSDSLVAYETPPRPGARRPAIVWITGGFNWGIDATLWKPAPRSNDQTASALRRADIVVMFPALRGFSGNPGKPECFLGEVDDILAAAEHLAQRPDVDPARIYLGGHSTGGTLALLAAASTDRFRAVFAFGPISDPRHYGSSGCLPSGRPPGEYAARAPAHWMGSIVTPTLVIEGADGGNAGEFPALHEHASPVVKFAAIAGADHFTVLAPATEALARAIAADTGPQASITLDTAAIARGVETSRSP